MLHQISFDAIVFDLDGVLVDTEPLAWDVYCEIFSAQGITLTEEQAAATIGVDMPGTARLLLEATGLTWSPEELLQKHLSRLYQRFSVELSPFPGAVELVHQLAAAGIPLGVASNSPVDYVRRVLCAIALEPHFKAIIGRDLVINPKPHPDVYLEACRQLNAEPTRCLAVEDSQVGLQAALAAGLSAAWIHPPIPSRFLPTSGASPASRNSSAPSEPLPLRERSRRQTFPGRQCEGKFGGAGEGRSPSTAPSPSRTRRRSTG